MMSFVLDASATMAWCFKDEASAESWKVLDRLRSGPAEVPTVWPYEVANALAMAERRRRIDAAAIAEFLGQLADLDIQIDEKGSGRALIEVLALARRESLSTYDAAYLDLAMRAGLPLATRDRGLADAARRSGVVVIPA